MIKPDDTSHVFIVRIWWEVRDLDQEPMFWRGKVEYLNHRTEKFFTNLEDLKSFISAHIHAGRVNVTPREKWKKRARRWIGRILRML